MFDFKNEARKRMDLLAEQRAQIAADRVALERAESALVPKAEMKARSRAYVARMGAHWLQKNGTSVIHAFGSPALVGDPQGLRLLWEPLQPDVLYAAVPDFMNTILDSLIDQTSYEEGAPASARPALIATIAARLADREQTEETFVDELIEAGIQVAHRPEVLERRAKEAREKELEAERAAQSQSPQEAVDARHARRFGPR